jgi:hypothetical protein
VRKTCCWGSTKAIHNAKTVYFSPNINRVATSHLAEDLTGELSGVSGRPDRWVAG